MLIKAEVDMENFILGLCIGLWLGLMVMLLWIEGRRIICL